jgi:hypothetical protein
MRSANTDQLLRCEKYQSDEAAQNFCRYMHYNHGYIDYAQGPTEVLEPDAPMGQIAK